MKAHPVVCCILLFLSVPTWGCFAADEPTNEKPNDKPSSKNAGDPEMSKKVIRTEQEWKKLLSREEYRVLRMKGTERPFRNKYDHHFEPGSYSCAACGLELFDSDTKFNSGCGWPAFYAAKAGQRVKLTPDYSLGMVRTEVTCARCDSHLGHIFQDAPQTPTGQRYCINSVSLKFKPAGKDDVQGRNQAKDAAKSEAPDEKAESPAKE